MVAKRMREKADEMEEAKVDVRREDKTIRDFTIPAQESLSGGDIARHFSFGHERPRAGGAKSRHLTNEEQASLLTGPNGIGKKYPA